MANNGQRELKHFFNPTLGKKKPFTSPGSGGGDKTLPERNRESHALHLQQALSQAIQSAEQQLQMRNPAIEGGKRGFYLEFDLPLAQKAALDKLEDYRGADHIELVSVRRSETDPQTTLSATVFVPQSKQGSYLKKIEQYRTESTSQKGNPKNQELIESIDNIRLAAEARSLFTDTPSLFPNDQQEIWWEVWLRPEGRQYLERISQQFNIEVRDHFVTFSEREIALVRATPSALGRVLQNSDAIAELRLARDTPSIVMDWDWQETPNWVSNLAERVTAPDLNAPSVCVLDSGSTQQHPLIRIALSPSDQQAWNSTWTVADTARQWGGHGTKMCGLALYGDLTQPLIGSKDFDLRHRLESVKILPDQGANDPDLYGYITASAVSVAEIQASTRKRAYCLAVTSDGPDWQGRPTSWSAKIDDLAFGDGSDQRLFIISAGNIASSYPASEYLVQNDTSSVENPAQAWNALTVGAITEKCTITDPTFSGWHAVAPAGDLSPYSRTSVSWRKDWPFKPDIVMEGGNCGTDPARGVCDHLDDLSLLTTNNQINSSLFTTFGDTSAATALAAKMAAQIYADNEHLWPETVRALIIHSAEWTPTMMRHLPASPKNEDKRILLRRYGYGVPDLGRALRSLRNDVTLVFQETLQPFKLEKSSVKTSEMVLHELPWPNETLERLGDANVEMKVTLSYFVEPNPGERGWTKRHSYASHGLRFGVKRAEESFSRFLQRINKAERDENQSTQKSSGSDDGWIIGPQLRARGSVSSDLWRGSAADLASRGGIAVFPVGGWWREKKSLERTDQETRYALVVTVKALANIDLYTEIETQVKVDVGIEI